MKRTMRIQHESILTLQLPYREQVTLCRTVFYGGDRPHRRRVGGDSRR
jgi:hypothetical protein